MYELIVASRHFRIQDAQIGRIRSAITTAVSTGGAFVDIEPVGQPPTAIFAGPGISFIVEDHSREDDSYPGSWPTAL